MIRVGIVGFGFIGRMHYRCWNDLKNVQVAAIYEANPGIIEDLQRGIGNIEGANGAIDLSGVEVYTDFDKILTQGGLDAISITLPTFLHADFSIKALDAGLHVLCEKPMSLTIEDGDKPAKQEFCTRYKIKYVVLKRLPKEGLPRRESTNLRGY